GRVRPRSPIGIQNSLPAEPSSRESAKNWGHSGANPRRFRGVASGTGGFSRAVGLHGITGHPCRPVPLACVGLPAPPIRALAVGCRGVIPSATGNYSLSTRFLIDHPYFSFLTFDDGIQ